jgi:hypothetical protein
LGGRGPRPAAPTSVLGVIMNESRLNPDIKEAQVGVRQLRKIKIYPLSAADQFKFTDLFSDAIRKLVNASEEYTDVDFVAEGLKIIRDNIGVLLDFVVDPKDLKNGTSILEELTNNQIVKIAEIIYKVNYEDVQKKVTGLLGKLKEMKEELPLRRLSPLSSDTIPNTTSLTPSEEASEMGD